MRIVTWGENNNQEYEKRKNGESVAKTLKKVNQYDLQGNFIQEFVSIRNAARFINAKNHSGLIRCCKGRQKFAYGFIWRYSIS